MNCDVVGRARDSRFGEATAELIDECDLEFLYAGADVAYRDDPAARLRARIDVLFAVRGRGVLRRVTRNLDAVMEGIHLMAEINALQARRDRRVMR